MLGPLNAIPASLERLQSLPRRFLSYFLAAATCLAIWTYGASRALYERTRAGQEMQASYAVIAEVNRLSSKLLEAETGQRGYLLVFDPRYLNEYTSGRTGTSSSLERLERLLHNQPEQLARLASLGPLIDRTFAELGKTIDLKLKGEDAKALAVVSSDVGRQLMVDITRLISELSAREKTRLEQDRRDIERARRLTLEVLVGGGVLMGFLILLVGLVVRRDTGELAQLTQDRQETLLRLDAQLRLLANVVEQVPVRLIVREVPGGEILFSNSAPFARPTSLALASQTELLRRMDGSLYPPGQSPAERVERTGTEAPDEEAQLMLSDGSLRLLLVRAAPVFDREGRVVATVEVGDDITDRKRDEDLRENLMAIVGHDLRNPLSAIFTTAGILGGPADLTAETRRRVAEQMLSSARRMDRIIGLLLDYTRAQGRGLQVDPRATDLSLICQGTLEELQVQAAGRSVERETKGDTRGFWDIDRMGQVVSNLLTNAVKYGDRSRAVTLDLDGSAPDAVRLRVKNWGRPIAAESLPHIFEPFFIGPQTESTVRRSLGLGLYIVREIVLAHGGNIQATSSLALGTEFEVILPRDTRSRLYSGTGEVAVVSAHTPAPP